MIINKRTGIFETNSSSSHSISIEENDIIWDNILPNDDGIIYLKGGEFGWEEEDYDDALTKANYYAVGNKYNEEKLDLLKEVIRDYTGFPVIINISSDSYIDHQSSSTTQDIYTKEELKLFIFNKNSILTTDNDNH